MTDAFLVLWNDVPVWLDYLIRGLILCALLCFSAVILTRAGRSPYWALLMIVPYFYMPLVLIWAFALAAWPRVDAAKKAG